MLDNTSDDHWISHLRGVLADASARLGVTPAGSATSGAGRRSIGQPVAASGTARWLRVVTEPASWASGPAWEGNADANAIRDVPKPEVLDVAEWDDADRRVRAELQTLAPGAAVSDTIDLDDTPQLDEAWWASLRNGLDALADHRTDRVCLTEDHLRLRLLAFYGAAARPGRLTWTTAHGDLHWANLMAPACWILDWEAWGTAPAGYDAALLHCTSLQQPDVASRVHEVFADHLDTPTGRIAQLAAVAKLLLLVEHGHHPDLANPLHSHARALLDRRLGVRPRTSQSRTR